MEAAHPGGGRAGALFPVLLSRGAGADLRRLEICRPLLALLEVSSNSPAGIPIFQFKSVIVAAGILLFIQGIAQVFRCIICLRTGEWLRAAEDVEETEKVLMEAKTLDVLKHGGRKRSTSPRATARRRQARRRRQMSDPQIAVGMLLILILAIFLGFPVAFTLMALGVAFGYYAYFDAARMWRTYERAVEQGADGWTLAETWIGGLFNNRIFDLFVNQTYSVMSNDVLTAIPLFLFMGYIVERANIVDRLFTTLFIATRRVPGSMAVAALITCTLFATATGIVGAVVTLMGLLALPAMLKARYDVRYATGVICAGGTLGILHSALDPAHRLCRDFRRLGGAHVCGRTASRPVPCRALSRLCGRQGGAAAAARAEADATNRSASIVPQICWMMFTSFVPLAFLILAVLGAILFGLATPSEAAAIGALGRPAARRRLSGADLAAAEGMRLSDRAHLGDGVLAVRRLGDLRLGLRLSGRPAVDQRIRHRPRHVAADVPDRRAAHHLHSRLAAGMDGDHRHLHPDLPAAAAAFRASIRCSSASWWRSICRRRSCRRRWRCRPTTSRASRRPMCSFRIFRGMMPYMLIVILCMVIIYIFPEIVYWPAQPDLWLTGKGGYFEEKFMTRRRLLLSFAFLCLAAFLRRCALPRSPARPRGRRCDRARLAAYDLWLS